MAIPQALTAANITQLQTYANQGTITGVLNYYTLLESKGYDYATLAKVVVLDNTPAGSTARVFAENLGKNNIIEH
mgnify:CR=1 FL=1